MEYYKNSLQKRRIFRERMLVLYLNKKLHLREDAELRDILFVTGKIVYNYPGILLPLGLIFSHLANAGYLGVLGSVAPYLTVRVVKSILSDTKSS